MHVPLARSRGSSPRSHGGSVVSAATGSRLPAQLGVTRGGARFRGSASLSLVVGLVVSLLLAGTGASGSAAVSADAAEAAPAGQLTTGSAPAAAPPVATVRSAPDIDVAVEIPEVPEAPAGVERTEVFARVGDLALHLPAAAVVVTGFHQASTPGSVAMVPASGHRVLPSRGRGYPATSAVDVVLQDDERVRSPVSGTVTHVESYALYGRYPDRRVVIRPHADRDLRVVMLHVHGVQVEAGDEVEAGVTRIANRARRLPFRSQVDKVTAPDAWPHVHYEVKVRG
jgi:biotin carboxyl carrier protein